MVLAQKPEEIDPEESALLKGIDSHRSKAAAIALGIKADDGVDHTALANALSDKLGVHHTQQRSTK